MKERLVSWGLFGIMCLVLLTGCSTQARWQEQYDLGMRYLSESNYEEAILAFTEAIRINPEHADPYVYLIQGYLSAGQVEQAENIRLQGYEATGDTRLGQSVLDGSVFYDESIPFEERIFYRSFDLLSEDQQAELRQMIETLKTEDVEATQAFLSGGLPPLLCTIVDGYRVELLCVQGESLGTYHQSWLENEGGALTEHGWQRSYDRTGIFEGLLRQVRFAPENGIGYTCYYEQMTLDLSEDDAQKDRMMTICQGIKKNEWENWLEDGDMSTSTNLEIVYLDMEEPNSGMMQIETAGTVTNGITMTEMTRIVQKYDDGSQEVKEYDQEGVTSWYMESADGKRTDMMEVMSALMSLFENVNME